VNYPVPYITVAAAIGVTLKDINEFLQRFDKTLSELSKKINKREKEWIIG